MASVSTTTTPAAVTEPATIAPATAAVKTPAKPKRVPASKQAGVVINPARIRRYLDKLNLNKAVEDALLPIVSTINEYESATESLKEGTKVVSKTRAVVTQHKVTETVDGVATEKLVEKTKNENYTEVVALTEEDRKQLTAVVAGLEGKIVQLQADAAALRASRIRFSVDASIAVSIVCNRAISELVEHATKAVLAEKKKIVHSAHLFADGVKDLPLYPLVAPLQTFAAGAGKHAEAQLELANMKLAKEAAAAAVKAWRANHPTKRKKPAKKAAAAEVPEVPANGEIAALTEIVVVANDEQKQEVVEATPAADGFDDSDSANDTPASNLAAFKFYVSTICKSMREINPDYAKVRVSSEFRETLSALAIELINRLARHMLLMTNSMNIKTVNSDAVMRVVEMILIDGHAPVDTVELKQLPEPDPAAIEAEKAKRKDDPNYVKKPISELPTRLAWVAVRSTSYPTSAFGAVDTDVRAKLSQYASVVADHKAANAAAKAVAAAAPAQVAV